MGESVCEHTVNIQRTHSVHTVNTHSVCVNAHCLEWTHMFTDYVSSYSLSDIYIDSKFWFPVSICLSVSICVYLSVCPSVYLPACLSICLFFCNHLYLCLITTTYVCPSSVCLSLSIYLL